MSEITPENNTPLTSQETQASKTLEEKPKTSSGNGYGERLSKLELGQQFLVTSVETHAREIKELSKDVGASRSDNAVLATKIDSLEKRVYDGFADVNRRFDESKENFNTKIEAVNGRIEAVNGRIDSVNGRIDSLEKVINIGLIAINDRIEDLEKRIVDKINDTTKSSDRVYSYSSTVLVILVVALIAALFPAYYNLFMK